MTTKPVCCQTYETIVCARNVYFLVLYILKAIQIVFSTPFIFCGRKFNTLNVTTLKRWWPTKTKSVRAFGGNIVQKGITMNVKFAARMWGRGYEMHGTKGRFSFADLNTSFLSYSFERMRP